MATTPTYINQRINNLQAQINDITTSGVPTTSDLAVVLANGNSAGGNSLNMDNSNIDAVGVITSASVLTNDITVTNNTGYTSSTLLNGYDIQTSEQNVSIGNDAVVNPGNIYVEGQDFGANISASASLEQGSLVCDGYNNTLSGDFARIRLTTSPIALVGSFFDYTKTAGYPQSYLPFKYNNAEIFRYNANQILMADTKTIVLNSGGLLNTINGTGYTTRNSVQNLTHFLTFVDSSASGVTSIQKTAGISCNPASNTVTATTFVGALTGNASSASAVTLVSDNTNTSCYIPFSKTTAGSARILYVDDATGPLLYNPSTGTLTTTAVTLTGTPATASTASKFGQVGLVKLQTLTGTITGAVTPVDFNLSSIFNASYANYKIIFSTTPQVSFTGYPSYSLKAFLGTGAPVPTTASLSGYEITSSNPALVTPIWTSGATIGTTPLVFAVSGLVNTQVEFDVKNVGFANTASNQITLKCKSEWNNPGITGSSDRTISATSGTGTTITGLTIQQGALSAGNNMNWSAIIYGYNQL